MEEYHTQNYQQKKAATIILSMLGLELIEQPSYLTPLLRLKCFQSFHALYQSFL